MTKRKYTLIPDAPDDRDFLFKSVQKSLPEMVDLRSKMSPIVNQESLGSCAENAYSTGMLEYMLTESGRPFVRMSRLDPYYKVREIMGTILEDSGTMLRDLFKVAKNRGVAPESDYPYVIANYTNPPSAQAELHAADYKIAEYHRILQVNEMKEALAEGKPVLIGIQIYESFESQTVADSGMVPFPNLDTETYLGGHALLVVGYMTAENGTVRFITRNSWGSEWGDRGYCYLPQKIFETNVVSDMWVAQLTLPIKPEDLSFQQSIAHFVEVGAFADPVFWANFETKFKAGLLVNKDFENVFLGYRKLAAYDLNRK